MSFVLMIVGSIMTGYYDLEFSLRGYLWMATNCLSQVRKFLFNLQSGKIFCRAAVLTVWLACSVLPHFAQAAYVLYMRQAKKTTQLSEWGMSLYNNALCIGLMAVTAVLSGEISAVCEGHWLVVDFTLFFFCRTLERRFLFRHTNQKIFSRTQASRFPDWDNAGFLVSLIFSGVVGTCLSLSVFWCISVTSPTTYRCGRFLTFVLLLPAL